MNPVKPWKRIPNVLFSVDIKPIIYTRPNHGIGFTFNIEKLIICSIIFFCFNRINSYLQLIWHTVPGSKAKRFTVNILLWIFLSTQEIRCSTEERIEEKKKKHIQVTNAIWKIHTMNIKQIQEKKNYSMYNIYLKWIFVEIFSAQLIRKKEIKPSKSQPECWTHVWWFHHKPELSTGSLKN